MFLLHTHHHISFPLFCCQGDAKILLSKQLNNQDERQPAGGFESLQTSLHIAALLEGGPFVRFATSLTTDRKKRKYNN